MEASANVRRVNLSNMSAVNAVQLSHLLMRDCVRAGSVAVDATAGNGHDTRLLAELVGPSGQVHAFDVQQEAIAATAVRMRSAEIDSIVRLHHAGHETAAEVLAGEGVTSIGAAMFNLGYLPGGNKAIITQPATTCQAISSLLPLIEVGGLVTLVLYCGHRGGTEEAAAVISLTACLPANEFATYHFRPLNQGGSPPQLVAIQRHASRPR
jgi:predicted methyltransferase